ncbi:LacI family DNA-binding transcriptional regulator [Brachybacterium sp. ACRRE]|uniref:LacI family DNA-binding transcriptional regulator n=1 Tax=Brachybacterium sp. ACRRE TaxID=2918184 RepID=UPI001EF38D46|nr:LacI family DNA-binding transcriptional regulator [Brachybacterium sp. ACRRE]MCG7310719.1 LacI family transcriptional regulator [Brachybacterium sp. ACRRE]
MTPAHRDVTIGDVAKRAGVSRAQTARALGGYGAVSDALHSRVKAAADALGYRANSLARSVSTGRSQSVGVVVGDIENPFFALSVRGISDILQDAGYDVVLMNTGESPDREMEAVRALEAKRMDGYLVAPAIAPSFPHLQTLIDAGRPLVLFDRDAPGVRAPSVVVDVEDAARELTDTLVAAGHQRIGFVSTLSHPSVEWNKDAPIAHTPVGRRLFSVDHALQRHDLALQPENVRMGARDDENIRRHVRDLVTGDRPVTTLLASDAVIAVAALEEFQSLGISVPHDVSVAVFDDPPWAGLVSPPLTVVSQPVLEAAKAAAGLLLDAMAGRTPATHPALVAHLIQRRSIGAARADHDAYRDS